MAKQVIETPNSFVEKSDVYTPGQESEERVSTTIAVSGDENNSKHSFASSVSFSSNKQREGHSAWESEKSRSKADGGFLDHIRGKTSYYTTGAGGGYDTQAHSGYNSPAHGAAPTYYNYGKSVSYEYTP